MHFFLYDRFGWSAPSYVCFTYWFDDGSKDCWLVGIAIFGKENWENGRFVYGCMI